MCEWMSGNGIDVQIEPSEEWKNLPVDPITATGGPSKEWDTFGTSLLQEFAEQSARSAVGFILRVLLGQGNDVDHNLALPHPGPSISPIEHVRPTVPIYHNCPRGRNSCDCDSDKEIRCFRFGAIPRRTLFGTVQDESHTRNSNRGRFLI